MGIHLLSAAIMYILDLCFHFTVNEMFAKWKEKLPETFDRGEREYYLWN